jgi:hypothetical protein
MWKVILQSLKTTALIAGFSTLMNSAIGQQHIIADKDNTHPELTRQQYDPAKIFLIRAIPNNGFNEIQWSAVAEQGTRRFIVEYSTDGINFLTAGESLPLTGSYSLKHYTPDTRSILYRIRMENKDGRFYNSSIFLLDGYDHAPVKIYPTVVEGSTINMQLWIPVERINIFSPNGQQVFSKELGGFMGSTQIVIPSISRGNYMMTFYGKGWQTTERFVIAR